LSIHPDSLKIKEKSVNGILWSKETKKNELTVRSGSNPKKKEREH
jgi:hypothetical protein